VSYKVGDKLIDSSGVVCILKSIDTTVKYKFNVLYATGDKLQYTLKELNQLFQLVEPEQHHKYKVGDKLIDGGGVECVLESIGGVGPYIFYVKYDIGPAVPCSLKGLNQLFQLVEPDMSTVDIVKDSFVGGTKHDDNKIPLELLSPIALDMIGEVLKFGATKYDSHNWRKGFGWSRLIGAALRHILAFMRGQDNDPETGLSHIAHAGCCIMFLLEHIADDLGSDDRYKKGGE
jgi:hypothetical protein